MKTFKKIISFIMVAAVIASICVVSTISSGASGTGAGLAEWALNAYYNDWSYVWGGASPGAVDCSGLIWSYCGGNRISMLSDAQSNGRDWGYVSSGIPRVHGLGLSRPGHVGVYIADNMEVDARGSDYGVCYQEIGGWNTWDCWFKLTAVSYPVNGWEQFNGDSYYYEDGEYIVNTSRTIDGVTYYFDSKGRSSSSPSDASASYADTSSGSSSGSSSSSDTSGVLKKGSTGSLVEKLQKRLQELGYYNGAVDGDFGEVTESAFKQFQKNAGLYVDGIAGSDTDYLYADDAPAYVSESSSADTEETEDETEAPLTAKEVEDIADTGVVADFADEAKTEEPAELKFALGDSSDSVADIQNRLIVLGYLTGEADGSYGAMTEEAVKSFQLANNITATGIVEQGTYDVLFSDSAVAAEKEEPDAPAEDAEKKTEDKGAVSNAPAEAKTQAPAKSTVTPSTDVEVKTSELSSKSVAAVAESPLFKQGANGTNFEFILWLAIMIVVMVITFTIVYAVEKKKQRAAYHGKRFH